MQFKLRLFIAAFISFFLLLYYNCRCPKYFKQGNDDNIVALQALTPANDVLSSTVKCATIHIAFVASGYNTTKAIPTVLKSILFYRHNPIHFHFITDPTTQLILQELMRTWIIPSLNYTFYSTEGLIKSIEWIPNAHYSGVFGLMKLLLPNVLSSVDKVITLDTDITVAADIGELWKYFNEMKKSRKAIGLVENQSEWYLGTIWIKHKPWPAVGRGFNTGVMLMDLTKLRSIFWDDLWMNVTVRNLEEYQYTSLADQDIINAIVKDYPALVYSLPCAWNVQLSDHSHSEDCYLQSDDYKIIHWNSPSKMNLDNKYTPYFRNLHHAFAQYDGNLLRQELLHCKDTTPTFAVPSYKDNDCSLFVKERQSTYRIHLYYYGSQYTPYDEYDVTYVTQLSLDRIQNIQFILKHWEGPVTFVIYCTDSELWLIKQHIASFSSLLERYNVAIHVVYREGELYPINFLRNVALNFSSTPYVFINDVDFLPMFNLYNYLRESIKILKLDVQKRALVIPAFESLQYRLEFPHDKQTLLKMLQLKLGIQIFRQDIWENGHSAVNYDKWYQASNPYKISWVPDFEPYITVHRNVSRYDENFIGFGWNKVSHIIELYAQEYEFIVLPDAFIVHTPHASSIDINRYRTSHDYRKCLNNLKRKFIKNLIKKYGNSARKFGNVYSESLEQIPF
jgi:glycosyltransferase-like protein LARGE